MLPCSVPPVRSTNGFAIALCCLLSLGSTQAFAATYRVGGEASCTYANIQAAINAAQNNPGPDTILVARSTTYTAQELLVDTSQELNIIGGYDSCTSPTPSGMTTVSGAGGSAQRVFRIYGRDGSLIRLRHLMIRNGDTAGSGEGGGIYYEGNGRLELHDSSIIQNTAGYGAGLYLRGTGSQGVVEFGQNVIVANNTARYSGGGVYVDQLRQFFMQQPGSVLMWNTAEGANGSGYGGGLTILDKGRGTTAFIGSGVPGVGAIASNTAVYGGGVAVVGDDPGSATTAIISDSVLRVQQTVANQPAMIRDNVASQRGGGIYLRPYNDTDDLVRAQAWLWNAELSGNSAPAGAAIYSVAADTLLGSPRGGRVHFNAEASGYSPGGTASCPSGQFCGGIFDNIARDINGQATTGAVIHLEEHSQLLIGHNTNGALVRGGLRIEGNRGGRLIHAGGNTPIHLQNTLIADNQTTNVLIQAGNNEFLRVVDTTLTGNVIGGSHVFAKGDGPYGVTRSILWQPGKTILQCSGCSKAFEYVIASERASLDGGQTPHVQVSPPRFIDPDRGDYRLRAASPAIDYAPPITGDDRDVLGLPRDQDLPIVSNWNGVRDLGAFERPTLQPLVLNADFDSDLNLWITLVPGSTSRDPDQNGSGPAGSGSLRVSHTNFTPPRVVAARQCLHLPGPGRYKLNGWGRSSGVPAINRDSAVLRWDLRLSGGEGCVDGPIVASGDHVLGSSTAWNRPANPAMIDIGEADWTWQSSITVSLVVIDNGLVGQPSNSAIAWFDGIRLEVESLDDVIFADGFDP